MFVEPNPQPVKAAMELMGKCNATVRLPMVACSEEGRKVVEEHLRQHGLL